MKKSFFIAILSVSAFIAYMYFVNSKIDRELIEENLESYLSDIYSGSDMCVYLNNNTKEKIYSDFNGLILSDGKKENTEMLEKFVSDYLAICNSELAG
jgi:hypothetical protein